MCLFKSFLKFLAVVFAASVFVFPLSAQNAGGANGAGTEGAAEVFDGDEAINLPDVSTEIQGGAPKVGRSAVPDFSKILPERQTSELVPRLPEATAPDSSAAKDISSGTASGKSIYAEGLAGLGYPGFFTGKFSVYNQTGLNPFRITFGHETLNGYAGNSLTSGYFDRDTLISAQKTFSFDKGKFIAEGLYNSITTGLQNKNDNISDVTKDLMEGGGKFNLKFGQGFTFESEIDGSWYRRYGNIVGTPSEEIAPYLENVSVVTLLPRAGLSYGYKGFFAGTELGYRSDIDATDSFEKSFESRFNGGLYAGWGNEIVRVKAGCDLLFGSQIGDNSILVPFLVESSFSIPVGFSVRPLKIGVKGGLSSFAPEISELEIENAFTAFDQIPCETTDWLCELDLSLPVKESFTFSLSGEFRNTAFGNGTWTGEYDDSTKFVSGQYLYTQKEMLQVNTKTAFSYKCKAGIFGAEWKSAWADKSTNSFEQFVKATYSFQTKTSFFTFDASVGFTPDSNKDNTPFVDFEAALKVSSAVRLAFTGTDIVKLISGSSRDYAGEFISRSGNVGLLAKFVF